MSVHYSLDLNDYLIGRRIGSGMSSVVYWGKFMDSEVAIKGFYDDQKLKSDDFEPKLMIHPNILQAHCSIRSITDAEASFWMVMPLMSGGSVQSIIAYSSYQDGLPEPCIASIMKEILNALSYLHRQGHPYRDIKASNILIDSDGSVKLADESTRSSSPRFTGTPYWMAPEVIASPTDGYGIKADIFSFGITALEIAHGRPPLFLVPPSESEIMNLTRRLRFYDHYDKKKASKKKDFSKCFKDMVGLCIDPDPSKRPTADDLLAHSFFKNCQGPDFLIESLLQGVPPLEHRFKEGSNEEGFEFNGGTSDDSEKDLVISPVDETGRQEDPKATALALLDAMGLVAKMAKDYIKRSLETPQSDGEDDDDGEVVPTVVSEWMFNEEEFELIPVVQEIGNGSA